MYVAFDDSNESPIVYYENKYFAHVTDNNLDARYCFSKSEKKKLKNIVTFREERQIRVSNFRNPCILKA